MKTTPKNQAPHKLLEGEYLTDARFGWEENQTLSSSVIKGALEEARGQKQADSYYQLAYQLEQEESHFSAVLGVRRRAVFALKPQIQSKVEQKALEPLQDWLNSPPFLDLLEGLLDCLLVGIATVELIWSYENGLWLPSQAKWRDPRLFEWDFETQILSPKADLNVPELPPFKLITTRLEQRGNSPRTAGIAYSVASLIGLKRFILARWASFVECYGAPLRLGKYHPAATETDKQVLRRAVRSLGRDAAAILPENMPLEFVEAKNQQGETFENLLNWLNREISKAVLGQTMTTEDGSSLSQAQVHNEVREDITRADARSLERAIQGCVAAIWQINQWKTPLPRFQLHLPNLADDSIVLKALNQLVPLGLQVDQSWVRTHFGIPEPQGETLGPKSPLSMKKEEGQHKMTPHGHSSEGWNPEGHRANRAQKRSLETHVEKELEQDELEALIEQAQANWPSLDLLEGVDSMEEAQRLSLYPSETQVNSLAEGILAARVFGEERDVV